MPRPKGISVPVRPNDRSGLKMVQGDDYIEEIIVRAISPNYSEHPFEALTLDEDMIFAIDDPSTRVRILNSLRRAFEYLERIGFARPAETRPFVFEDKGKAGETELSVHYTNLQTQDPGIISRTLRPQQ